MEEGKSRGIRLPYKQTSQDGQVLCTTNILRCYILLLVYADWMYSRPIY